MKFIETELNGAYIICLDLLEDERGFFSRTFCRTEFAKLGLNPHLEQCNLSYNEKKGTLRGMHFQSAPNQEAKLVRCTHGAIYDVIIDLRVDSPSYKKWISVELSHENGKMLYVPEGFAHGFQTLEDNTEVFYQMSHRFVPESSKGLRWNDPEFAIEWPSGDRIISFKDQQYANF